MRICVPTESNLGQQAKVYDHFGSAPFFTIYDDSNDSYEILDNSNQHHIHSRCNPLSVIKEKNIDAVVCRGMGRRAIQGLNSVGIKVMITDAVNIESTIQHYKNNNLSEMTLENSCQGRGHACH